MLIFVVYLCRRKRKKLRTVAPTDVIEMEEESEWEEDTSTEEEEEEEPGRVSPDIYIPPNIAAPERYTKEFRMEAHGNVVAGIGDTIEDITEVEV